MIHRRRALAVVSALFLAVVLVPLLHGASSTPAGAQTTPPCSYPFNNCTTTTSPATTTPGNTTTTLPATTTTVAGCGHGKSDEHNPHCTTTTTPGATTTTVAGCGQGNANGNPHCTTTTAPGNPPILTLILNLTSAVPGTEIVAVVCGAPPGAEVRITFNGNVVADVRVGSGSCQAPSALGKPAPGVVALAGPLGQALSVRTQTVSGTGTARFTVPSVNPGDYLVCAEAAGMESACSPFKVLSDASVLGNTFTNGGAPLLSANNGDSFLAFTGLGLVRLLMLAGVLIALGWFLVRRNRTRLA